MMAKGTNRHKNSTCKDREVNMIVGKIANSSREIRKAKEEW